MICLKYSHMIFRLIVYFSTRLGSFWLGSKEHRDHEEEGCDTKFDLPLYYNSSAKEMTLKDQNLATMYSYN